MVPGEPVAGHQAKAGAPGAWSGLLFPSPYKKDPRPLTNIYDALKACAERAGIDKHVTHHTFRHTYCAARLQTTEASPTGPVPVRLLTGKEEMGHARLKMIEEFYGHLDDRRCRHREAVKERVSYIWPFVQRQDSGLWIR